MCVWKLLKRFSRSEVKGQGHSDAKCTFPTEDTHRLAAVRALSVRQRHACIQKRRCGVEADLSDPAYRVLSLETEPSLLPTVWYSLPESVRSAETLASFKRKLKIYLFNISF